MQPRHRTFSADALISAVAAKALPRQSPIYIYNILFFNLPTNVVLYLNGRSVYITFKEME